MACCVTLRPLHSEIGCSEIMVDSSIHDVCLSQSYYLAGGDAVAMLDSKEDGILSNSYVVVVVEAIRLKDRAFRETVLLIMRSTVSRNLICSCADNKEARNRLLTLRRQSRPIDEMRTFEEAQKTSQCIHGLLTRKLFPQVKLKRLLGRMGSHRTSVSFILTSAFFAGPPSHRVCRSSSFRKTLSIRLGGGSDDCRFVSWCFLSIYPCEQSSLADAGIYFGGGNLVAKVGRSQISRKY